MEPRISIVIANYNSSDYAISCIKSIIDKHDMSDKEIIVVDDGSTREEIDKLLDVSDLNQFPKKMRKDFMKSFLKSKKVRIKELLENKGLGNAINKGNKLAKSKYLVKLDSDTIIIHKNFFDKLAKFLDEDKGLGLVTCKTDNIGQSRQFIRIPDVFETDEEIEEFMSNSDKKELTYHNKKEEAYSGMMFIYRREDIEKFKIEYCTKTKFLLEDNIFYLDVLRKMKKDCAIANKLFIRHTTNASKGNTFDSDETLRNRMLAKEIWDKEEL